jgi:hypothetical protein
MAGGLFFISMFIISVISILLFTPGSIQPNRTGTPTTTSIESQTEITKKMAQFLEKNPNMVKQDSFDRFGSAPTHSPSDASPEKSTTFPSSVSQDPGQPVNLQFLNSNMSFPSKAAYQDWVAEQVKQDPITFIREMSGVEDLDLYLETMKKVTDISTDPQTVSAVHEAYMNKAGEWITQKDVFHQHMTQRALQQYLDSETDQEQAKKRVDDFLQQNQNLQNQ